MAQIPCDCGGKLHSGKSTYKTKAADGRTIAAEGIPSWTCDNPRCGAEYHDLDRTTTVERLAGWFGRKR